MKKNPFFKILLSLIVLAFYPAVSSADVANVCQGNFSASFVYDGLVQESNWINTAFTIPIGSKFNTKLSLISQGKDVLENGENIEVMLVMDRSGSMSWPVDDSGSGEIKINEAKKALNGVVDLLIEENDNQNMVGLVTYSNNISLDSSLTSNYPLVKEKIDSIIAGGNTSIGGGLKVAGLHLANENFSDKNKRRFIILASDGLHNTPPSIEDGILAVPDDVTVFTVGIGLNTIDSAPLKKISNEAGNGQGEYYFANTGDIAPIFREIMVDILKPFKAENVEISFFRKNTDSFGLIMGEPDYTSESIEEGKITWSGISGLSEMPTGSEFSANIYFNQKSGFGTDIELNDDYVLVSYDWQGENCQEMVPIGKILIDNNPRCTGDIPSLATLCSGDEIGLIKDQENVLVDTCSGAQKCEYVCKAPFKMKDGKCVLEAVCGSLSRQTWCKNPPKTGSFCSMGKPSSVRTDSDGKGWSWTCEGTDGESVSCKAERICDTGWVEVSP